MENAVIETNLIDNFKEILEISQLSVNDNFRELPEWDSLANLSVIAMIDEEFGIVFENSEFKKIQTLAHLLAEIKIKSNA